MRNHADKTKKQRSKDEDNQENLEAKDYPKGGWKWMILFSAFIFNVIVDGCSYSFGVLYTRLVKDFKSSRSDTAWIGSVFASAPLLCGPVASIVTNRYGFRKASIFGGIIAFIGLFSSVFAPSVEILCITFGVIGGIGFSLPYLVSSVIVPIYFHRKVALASGIAECGSGVGTLIFAPLLEYLISEYDWRGAILITAGIVANTVVCGALNRPFKLSSKEKDEDDSDTSIPKLTDKTFLRDVSETDMVSSKKQDEEDSDTSIPKLTDKTFLRDVSETDMVSSKKQDEEDSETSMPKLADKDVSENEIVSSHVFTSGLIKDAKNLHVSTISNVTYSECMDKTVENEHSTSCSKLKVERNKEEETCRTSKCSSTVFDTSILLNWRYIMFSLSNIILYLWYDIPYMFTVDRAVELGEREFDASLLISAVGVLHTIGNIVFGFIGDRKGVNRSLFYSVALWICGLSLAVVPLFDQLIDYGIFIGGYGLFSAVTEALKVAILVDIVGMAKLTDAYGLLLFLQGIANLTGPPIAGRLFDVTGTYDYTFYIAGISLVVAGIFSVIPSVGLQNNSEN